MYAPKNIKNTTGYRQLFKAFSVLVTTLGGSVKDVDSTKLQVLLDTDSPARDQVLRLIGDIDSASTKVRKTAELIINNNARVKNLTPIPAIPLIRAEPIKIHTLPHATVTVWITQQRKTLRYKLEKANKDGIATLQFPALQSNEPVHIQAEAQTGKQSASYAVSTEVIDAVEFEQLPSEERGTVKVFRVHVLPGYTIANVTSTLPSQVRWDLDNQLVRILKSRCGDSVRLEVTVEKDQNSQLYAQVVQTPIVREVRQLAGVKTEIPLLNILQDFGDIQFAGPFPIVNGLVFKAATSTLISTLKKPVQILCHFRRKNQDGYQQFFLHIHPLSSLNAHDAIQSFIEGVPITDQFNLRLYVERNEKNIPYTVASSTDAKPKGYHSFYAYSPTDTPPTITVKSDPNPMVHKVYGEQYYFCGFSTHGKGKLDVLVQWDDKDILFPVMVF